jgi:ABC-2 type transport system ATP-binding protein
MIEVQNISKNFDKNLALSNIHFTLKEGEITALLGENGAGKSTLMRILCGYISPTTGKICIYGNDIEANRLNALQCIGYVPEISSLYNDMTVYSFLEWIAQIWQLDQIEQAILHTANTLHLTEVLSQQIHTLSKGFRKRVEIASAIIHTPKFLILDEPTDGLDPNQKEDIRHFIKDYAKKNIVLVSTHVLEDAEIANRVIMLSHGKIVHDTTIAQFKKVSKSKNLAESFRILSHEEPQK